MYKTLRIFGGFINQPKSNNNSHNVICVVQSVRSKHFNPKFKWLRSKKVQPITLVNRSEKVTKEKMRTRMKELGISPPRYWKDDPVMMTTAHDILDPYEPPAGDGKASLLNRNAVGSMVQTLKDKQKNFSALRNIRNYDSNFKTKIFPQEAHDIYVNAHTAAMKKDPELLSAYATERANFEMMEGLKFKTLKWKFIESLEPPVTVQVRTAPVVSETNLFAQVTVRFHTKQCLAIYDRFGRLFYGSEILAKDVLEYVVFEKHIVNEYGIWRMHAKIIPDWVPSSEPSFNTYRIENLDDADVDEEDEFIEETNSSEHSAEIVNNPKTQASAG